MDALTKLFGVIWEANTVPRSWRRTTIIPIPKPGRKVEVANMRGILLLDESGKLFQALLTKTLEDCPSGDISENQGAFRKG